MAADKEKSDVEIEVAHPGVRRSQSTGRSCCLTWKKTPVGSAP
jgi:hypothetical protein